eukprot:2855443-Rhodomonas_salina.1
MMCAQRPTVMPAPRTLMSSGIVTSPDWTLHRPDISRQLLRQTRGQIHPISCLRPIKEASYAQKWHPWRESSPSQDGSACKHRVG